MPQQSNEPEFKHVTPGNVKRFNLKSQLVRDMFAAGFCVSIGIVVLPGNFLASDNVYYGVMAGISLGFGWGYLIRSVILAKANGKLVGNKIVD